jgi:preprotein translocase subunit SecG
MLYQILIVVLLLIAIAMIALILVQQGKGAGMGASFGAGASNTVFGSAGSGNFLTRSTWFLIILFFAVCLALGYLQKAQHETQSSFSNLGEETAQTETAPAVTTDAPSVETDAPAVSAKEETATDAPKAD